MKHSEKEIIDALNVIQDVCGDMDCYTCPFSRGAVCVINEVAPSEWDIVDVKPTFKAFK